ncbi:MAG: hypothetical protein ACR2LR_17600 [Hassallia sp.]
MSLQELKEQARQLPAIAFNSFVRSLNPCKMFQPNHLSDRASSSR